MSQSLNFFTTLADERPPSAPYADLRLLARLNDEIAQDLGTKGRSNYVAPTDDLTDVEYGSDDCAPERCFAALPLEVVIGIAHLLPSAPCAFPFSLRLHF